MNIEIERKFLVKNNDFKTTSYQQKKIQQGFLNSDKNRVVRIRITDDEAFITVKGKANTAGTTRFEWEKPLKKADAEELLLLCEPTIIEKTRFYVKAGNHIFEVDEFSAENSGLIAAEVELNSESERFEKPSWLGEEVTGIVDYYNSSLSKHPYKDWEKS